MYQMFVLFIVKKYFIVWILYTYLSIGFFVVSLKICTQVLLWTYDILYDVLEMELLSYMVSFFLTI